MPWDNLQQNVPVELTTRKNRALFALSLLLPLTLYAGLAWRLIGARVGYGRDEALYTESAVFLLAGSGTPPSSTSPPRGSRLAAKRPLDHSLRRGGEGIRDAASFAVF
jgi:hypothetical protein